MIVFLKYPGRTWENTEDLCQKLQTYNAAKFTDFSPSTEWENPKSLLENKSEAVSKKVLGLRTLFQQPNGLY